MEIIIIIIIVRLWGPVMYQVTRLWCKQATQRHVHHPLKVHNGLAADNRALQPPRPMIKISTYGLSLHQLLSC